MKYAALGLLALISLAPAAAACGGLSPGDEILVGDLRCTLAFLLADRTGLYFSTAGHCIQEGDVVSNPDVGEFGVGYLHFLEPETGAETDGSPGMDFGLIRVDPAFYDKLNPKACAFDGPTGIYDATPGSGGVMHHGYGLLLGDLSPTRARQGFNLQNDNTAFYWTGAGVPGDSGSAVLHESGLALGVLTHLQAGATSDTNGGTHLYRGFALAKELKGMDLRLVLMGEDPVQVLAQMRAAPAPDTTPGNLTSGSTNGTNGTSPTRPPPTSGEPTPTGATPPPRNDDGELTPAANLDDKTVPAPGILLVLLALALVAARTRKASGPRR